MERGVGHKCLILCAGLGTRLRPLTLTIPKPLAPVYNLPLFDLALRSCMSTAPMAIAINTHHLPDVMSRHAQSSAAHLGLTKLHISLEKPDILGTGGALREIAGWWDDSDLLVYNGDILSDMRLAELLRRHRASSKNLATLAVRKEAPTGGGRSIWMDDRDHIKFIARKADLTPGSIKGLREAGFACAYVASPKLKDYLPKHSQFHDIVDTFNQAIAAGMTITGLEFSGLWADLGDPHALWQTNLTVAAMPDAQRNELLGPSRRIKSSIPETCKIDAVSVVADSVVVGANSSISRCILLEGASVAPGEILDGVLRGYGFNECFK